MRSLKQVLCEHDYKFDKGCLVCVKCDDVMHQMVADIIIKELIKDLNKRKNIVANIKGVN